MIKIFYIVYMVIFQNPKFRHRYPLMIKSSASSPQNFICTISMLLWMLSMVLSQNNITWLNVSFHGHCEKQICFSSQIPGWFQHFKSLHTYSSILSQEFMPYSLSDVLMLVLLNIFNKPQKWRQYVLQKSNGNILKKFKISSQIPTGFRHRNPHLISHG